MAASAREPSVPRWLTAALVLLAAVTYAALGRGLVSSNDGSHVALARALAVHHRVSLEDEVGLSLWIDWAERGERTYSDRPPGTAFVAAPAAWVGSRIDSRWRAQTLERLSHGGDLQHPSALLVHAPATENYTRSYGQRRLERGEPSIDLISLQGTALAIEIHCALISAAALWGMLLLMRLRGVGVAVRTIVGLTVGCATLFGPYSTTLFSHVTAAAALVWMLLAFEAGKANVGETRTRRWWISALAGTAGSLAVAADYALVLVVVPATALALPWRSWAACMLGALPLTVLMLAYHDAAFGSPFSIGYDHQASFEFARDRASTFGGDPLAGLWTLWGLGKGAGVLAQSPILAVGAVGLALDHRRLALAFLPWTVLLLFHHTPSGGAGTDHRYLVPAIPVLAVGLGSIWTRVLGRSGRAATIGAAALAVLTLASAILVWANFLAWRGD